MKRFATAAAVAALAVSGVATAATATRAVQTADPIARIAVSGGEVQVNRGDGFVSAGSTAVVETGDSVRPTVDGDLVYADGCRVRVRAGEQVEVGAASPCALGLMSFPAGAAGAGAIGTGAAVGGGAAIGSTGMIVGAGFLGGALLVGGAIADGDDEDPPISN